MPDQFTLIPPEGVVAHCKCGRRVTSIEVVSDSKVATILPCGCKLTIDEVETLIANAVS